MYVGGAIGEGSDVHVRVAQAQGRSLTAVHEPLVLALRRGALGLDQLEAEQLAVAQHKDAPVERATRPSAPEQGPVEADRAAAEQRAPVPQQGEPAGLDLGSAPVAGLGVGKVFDVHQAPRLGHVAAAPEHGVLKQLDDPLARQRGAGAFKDDAAPVFEEQDELAHRACGGALERRGLRVDVVQAVVHERQAPLEGCAGAVIVVELLELRKRVDDVAQQLGRVRGELGRKQLLGADAAHRAHVAEVHEAVCMLDLLDMARPFVGLELRDPGAQVLVRRTLRRATERCARGAVGRERVVVAQQEQVAVMQRQVHARHGAEHRAEPQHEPFHRAGLVELEAAGVVDRRGIVVLYDHLERWRDAVVGDERADERVPEARRALHGSIVLDPIARHAAAPHERRLDAPLPEILRERRPLRRALHEALCFDDDVRRHHFLVGGVRVAVRVDIASRPARRRVVLLWLEVERVSWRQRHAHARGDVRHRDVQMRREAPAQLAPEQPHPVAGQRERACIEDEHCGAVPAEGQAPPHARAAVRKREAQQAVDLGVH